MGKLTMKQLKNRRQKYNVYKKVEEYEEFREVFIPLLEAFEVIIKSHVSDDLDFEFYSNDMGLIYSIAIGPQDVVIIVRERFTFGNGLVAMGTFWLNNKEKTCLKEFNNPTVSISILKKVLEEAFVRYESKLNSAIKSVVDALKAIGLKDIESKSKVALTKIKRVLADVKEENTNLILNRIDLMNNLDRANHGVSQYKGQYENLLTKIDEMFGEGVGKAIEQGKFVAISAHEYNGLRKE